MTGLADVPSLQRLAVGPLAGVAVFLVLAGGRVPRHRRPDGTPPARRRLVRRWLGIGAEAGLEEVVWRGLVLGGLLTLVGPIGAIAVSSAGFAVCHGPALGRRCGVHLVTGSGFGIAFLAGGLAGAVLAHGVYNALVDWAVHAERVRLRGP